MRVVGEMSPFTTFAKIHQNKLESFFYFGGSFSATEDLTAMGVSENELPEVPV